MPLSANMRNRAGSAPARAGVMAAAKSPPRHTRIAVPNRNGNPTAMADAWIFRARVVTSMHKAAKAAAWAVHASIGMPPGGQLADTTQADAPNIIAKERAVRIKRVTDMRRNLVRRLRRMLTRFAGILRITA